MAGEGVRDPKELRLRLALLAITCTVCGLMPGCIATTVGTIPAGHATAVETAGKVADKIGMGAKKGPEDAFLEDGAMLFPHQHAFVRDADLFLWTGGSNGYQATGALRFAASGPDQVLGEATLAVKMGIDPADLGALFLELVNQQLRLDRGEQLPKVNPTKSSGKYMAWTMLTPIAGFHYAAEGNPYCPASGMGENPRL